MSRTTKGKNNVVRVFVKASPSEGFARRRPATPSQTRPTFGVSARLSNEHCRLSAERLAEGPKVGVSVFRCSSVQGLFLGFGGFWGGVLGVQGVCGYKRLVFLFLARKDKNDPKCDMGFDSDTFSKNAQKS